MNVQIFNKLLNEVTNNIVIVVQVKLDLNFLNKMLVPI